MAIVGMSMTERRKPQTTHSIVRWWHGWGPLFIFPFAVFLCFPESLPKWGFMWTLAFAIYAGCKWLTWRRTPALDTPAWKQAGYLLAWPGLDAAIFLQRPRRSGLRFPNLVEWFLAFVKFVLGLLLFFVVARFVPPNHDYLMGWIGMIGIVMTLHFGIFHLLSCAWRIAGVDARPLMNQPLYSESISEFWGRRWNLAFRDLTNRFLFRPLASIYGASTALFVSFFASGLIHDLVISIPSGAGYGGPVIFFVVQSLGIFVSHSELGRRYGLASGIRGRIFTALVLLLPVGLLLQTSFVVEIILPFMRALKAI